MRICRGAHVQFLTGALPGGAKTKESLREDKYLLGYLRCWPEMVISLPPLFFFVSRAGRDTAWLMLAQSCGMLGTHQDRRHFPGQLFLVSVVALSGIELIW